MDSKIVVNTLKPKYDALWGVLVDPGCMTEGAAVALLDDLLDEVADRAAAGEAWRDALLGVDRTGRVPVLPALRTIETLICGPGGWGDPRAMVYTDGSIATTKDGITWTMTTKTRAEVEAEAKEPERLACPAGEAVVVAGVVHIIGEFPKEQAP